MPCNHPLHAFRTGSYTANGKDDFVIGRNCDQVYPAWKARKNGHGVTSAADLVQLQGEPYLANPIPIPCGHCSGCRMEHAKEWKVRCCLEASKYSPEHVYFLTLTYGDWSLPRTKDGKPTLNKKDFQDFMKRLRKYSGKSCRYFACGEYGEHLVRPHFHAIIFGDVFDPVPDPDGHLRSQVLDDAWRFGLTDLQLAVPGAIAYVAGYVEKKQMDPNWESYPVKPFVLMSRKPAIGTLAVADQEGAILKTRKVYGDFGSPHSAKLPRTFLRKLEERFPGLVREWKQVNKARASRFQDIKDYWFGAIEVDQQGFRQDALDEAYLEKVRIKKI